MTIGSDTVTVRIRRATIEGGDPSTVTVLFDRFLSDEPDQKRNRVRFEVEGYVDDPRELYEIEEVREFFQRLFDDNEGLFYWIDPWADTFMFIGLMLYEPRRKGETVSLNPEDLRAYLERGLDGLDRFCAERGTSAGKSEDAITRFVKRTIGS